MADKYPEGTSDYRAPLLLGTENYNWWKGRMEVYLSREPLALRVVQKGPFEFKDKEGKIKDVDDLTEAELLKYSFNGKARNSLMNGLCPSECDKVSSCKSAKEIWDTLELYHEGSKNLKKVKLSKLMNEFGNFKLREGESIRESQARFQTNMNALKQLGKHIPQEEINMKILSAVPFIYEPKVTALESSPTIDTMDQLAVFAELEQFESKVKESQSSSIQVPVAQMKQLALHTDNSLLESEDESDEELALISRKIKKMIEKKNRLKRDKGRFSNSKKANKDSKDQTCFECGKPGHYKRYCYKLKSKQQAVFKEKKKAKALMTWSDDDSVSSDDSSGDMVNLALVGIDDDSVRGNSESGCIESDSEEDQSEVNSCKYQLLSENVVLEPLTMQECENVSMGEYYSLKAENSKLKEKNGYLKTMVQDLMSKVDAWVDKKAPTQADKDAEIKDLQAKLSHAENFNKILLKRNKTHQEEITELKKEIEGRDECLEMFKLRESIDASPSTQVKEPSQQADIISQQAEKIDLLTKEVEHLQKGMGAFIQGEESLKSMMNNTNIPLVREGIGMNANKKDKALRYEGKHGIPYDYAMPWKICNRCGKKGHLEKHCKSQNGQKSYHGGNKQKTAYYVQNGRTKTAYYHQAGRAKSPRFIQKWIKKSDLHVLYVVSANHVGPNKIWVPKG